MIEFYKATLDFLKTPYIWLAVVLATGMMNFEQITQLIELCK